MSLVLSILEENVHQIFSCFGFVIIGRRPVLVDYALENLVRHPENPGYLEIDPGDEWKQPVRGEKIEDAEAGAELQSLADRPSELGPLLSFVPDGGSGGDIEQGELEPFRQIRRRSGAGSNPFGQVGFLLLPDAAEGSDS